MTCLVASAVKRRCNPVESHRSALNNNTMVLRFLVISLASYHEPCVCQNYPIQVRFSDWSAPSCISPAYCTTGSRCPPNGSPLFLVVSSLLAVLRYLQAPQLLKTSLLVETFHRHTSGLHQPCILGYVGKSC